MFWSRPAMWCGLMLISAVMTAPARATADDWCHGIFIGCSPCPLPAAEEDAWQQASALAENIPEAFVLVGSGRSMQPLYSPGTILVLRHLPFKELQRGQTVLYRNQDKKVIAHVLVTKARDGWRAQGLNNASHDMEPVRADNLVGIVVAAFDPKPCEPAERLAALR
jgi:hypothetical protein